MVSFCSTVNIEESNERKTFQFQETKGNTQAAATGIIGRPIYGRPTRSGSRNSD